MEFVTIKRIYRDQKQGKFGPSTMTSIYTNEYPETRMSSFDKGLDGIKEGDKVEIEIIQKGEYKNFKLAKGGQVAKPVDNDLVRRVEKLEAAIFGEKKEELPEDDF